jgi:hypothetical protein
VASYITPKHVPINGIGFSLFFIVTVASYVTPKHVPINGIGTHILKSPCRVTSLTNYARAHKRDRHTHLRSPHTDTYMETSLLGTAPTEKKMCVSGLKPDIMVDIGDGAKAIKSGKPKPSALNPKL